MILSDRSIREALNAGRIALDPFDPSAIQPSSVDVRLAAEFLVLRNHQRSCIDVAEDMADLFEPVDATAAPFVLHPGEFALGCTLERVAVADDLVARLDGKSSLGRLGLVIHSTAGFVDAGFDGQITLELSNVATLPMKLYPGMKVGQLSFLSMTTPAQRPYGTGELGSKYQSQTGPQPSRYFENFAR